MPEALLDYHDYCHWLMDVGGKGSVGFSPEGEDEFNDLSKQAWTHLLMQIVKVRTPEYYSTSLVTCM